MHTTSSVVSETSPCVRREHLQAPSKRPHVQPVPTAQGKACSASAPGPRAIGTTFIDTCASIRQEPPRPRRVVLRSPPEVLLQYDLGGGLPSLTWPRLLIRRGLLVPNAKGGHNRSPSDSVTKRQVMANTLAPSHHHRTIVGHRGSAATASAKPPVEQPSWSADQRQQQLRPARDR